MTAWFIALFVILAAGAAFAQEMNAEQAQTFCE
jgi:hypothetical protein